MRLASGRWERLRAFIRAGISGFQKCPRSKIARNWKGGCSALRFQ